MPDENSVIGFTEIFDPATEKFIPVINSEPISFGASRHSFINGTSCYVISDGDILPDGSISSLAAAEYRKSGSELWYAYVSGGTVRITSSVYNSQNKSALLTFSDITENASDDFRQALKGAVGVNNVIALDKYHSGIYEPNTLIESISVYYSSNAAQKLMTKCGITPLGALSHETGGLNAISLDKTLLVINSQSDASAAGQLFIEAGSFAGRTAYRSVNVTFVFENSAWKLDTLL